jgi:hypothetical protein
VAVSAFSQVTVVPTRTSRWRGEKSFAGIVTSALCTVAPCAATASVAAATTTTGTFIA